MRRYYLQVEKIESLNEGDSFEQPLMVFSFVRSEASVVGNLNMLKQKACFATGKTFVGLGKTKPSGYVSKWSIMFMASTMIEQLEPRPCKLNYSNYSIEEKDLSLMS